ncbi:glycyl aminopeptidase, partial [Natronoarchaeum mannanilyticum]|uniref:glycyl aminopeptidase n=1 Tax=Natronoarchaeum mannanilyticum TaxID=926360 RepID=UPI0036225293
MLRRRVVLATLLVVTLVGGVAAPVASAPTTADIATASTSADRVTASASTSADRGIAGGNATTTAASDADTLGAEARLHRLPERPGTIAVELRYATPDRLETLKVQLFDDPTVESTDGFSTGSGGNLTWDGRTDDPTATYTLAVNRTLDESGPIAGSGSYTFVDTGEWALVQQPRLYHSWSWSGGGQVAIDRETTVDGSGAVGGRIAFLGAHETITHDGDRQQFRLVVPDAATMAEDPEDVFDSLNHASDALRVDDLDDEVFLIAAPTGDVGWGVRGLQTGDADGWVRDSERVDEPGNVWLHEYVHTRQDYETTEATRWFTEAAATYYAASLTLEQDRIEFERFRSRLSAGRNSRYADAVLSEPSTWPDGANYDKGALAAGEIDRRLRLAIASGATIQTPFQRMNERGEPISQAAFLSMVGDAGGEDPRATARRYTETSDAPALWSADEHEKAFGQLSARISYELPDVDSPDAIRVDGEYRQRSIGGERPITLVADERLSLDATVRNDGGTEGTYDAAFRVDGTVVDRRTGRLDADAERTLTFDRTFDEPGEYELSVGGAELSVTVREPAAARVTDVALDRDRLAMGEN